MLIFNGGGGGVTVVVNGVVVECGGGGWDIKERIVVCQTWTVHKGSSIEQYSVVNLEKY